MSGYFTHALAFCVTTLSCLLFSIPGHWPSSSTCIERFGSNPLTVVHYSDHFRVHSSSLQLPFPKPSTPPRLGTHSANSKSFDANRRQPLLAELFGLLKPTATRFVVEAHYTFDLEALDSYLRPVSSPRSTSSRFCGINVVRPWRSSSVHMSKMFK